MQRLKKNKNKLSRKPRNSSKDVDVHYENIFDNNVNFKERVIYVNDDISDFSLELFLKAFDELEKGLNPGPIRIEVSSYGGDVYEMLGMIDRMRSSPCHVITRGFGKIMSAATFILAAGDERHMGRNSWMMMHEMSDILKGRMSDIKNDFRHGEAVEEQMYDMYEEFSQGKTKAATFKKLCTGKDHYINAETVLKLGLIDKVIYDNSVSQT